MRRDREMKGEEERDREEREERRERDYFREVAYTIMKAGKSKICKIG